jgi:flagellin-like protein
MNYKKMVIGKKALSPIIAIVLLILITIAAGAIIAGFVVPFVNTGLDESTRCLDFKDYYSFK